MSFDNFKMTTGMTFKQKDAKPIYQHWNNKNQKILNAISDSKY